MVNIPREDELSVFTIKQASIFISNTKTLLALEPDFGTPLQPVTQANGIDLTAVSLEKVIKAHAADLFCQSGARKVGKAGTETTINNGRVLVRRAHIDGALQKLVRQSLQKQIFALSHCTSLPGHTGQQRIYNTMRLI